MNDLHDERPGRERWRAATEQPTKPRPDNTKVALILVGMICVTLVLISFACAWTFK